MTYTVVVATLVDVWARVTEATEVATTSTYQDLFNATLFMTDGIIEAEDSKKQLYSNSGRLETTIGTFQSDIDAETMADTVISDAMAFA